MTAVLDRLALEVFPGVSLLGRAFEARGWCVVRGPDVLWGGDIRIFRPPAGRFDAIIGGPPCQPFSPLRHLAAATGKRPRHDNLVPEFERVVAEGAPRWFLMEEVRDAPAPAVPGYAVATFRLDNCWLPADDGLGQEQRRLRVFSFGVRGGPAVDLRRWIRPAALELPEVAPSVTQRAIDNSDEAKGRVLQRSVRANDAPAPRERGWTERDRVIVPAVTGSRREIPVALGGSGKVKQRAVVAREKSALSGEPSRAKAATVMAGEGRAGVPVHVGNRVRRKTHRSFEECCRLQGLPADFLREAPFTAEGKFQVLGNGVPLPMGLAIAGAVDEAERWLAGVEAPQ